MNEDGLINLTVNDIKVMSYIFDRDTGVGLSKAKGITVEEIKSKTDEISESKVRNAINKLISCGYVDLAIKRGKKKSYHVTPEGFNYIQEIKKTVIKIKD